MNIDLNALAPYIDGEWGNWEITVKTEEEGKELLRLARIGQWAERHAIPFLKELANEESFENPEEAKIASSIVLLRKTLINT